MTLISKTPTIEKREQYLFTEDRPMFLSQTLVIIDSSVKDTELLRTGLKPGAEVVVLHHQLNGLKQITALVSRRKNLKEVHIVSHGSPGSLRLGTSELNFNNIEEYSTQLKSWFSNSKEQVSLLLYGCQVAYGVEGLNFVQKLHELTSANIAAATQIVGSHDRGGIWDLDYAVGTTKFEIIFNDETIQTYSGTFEDEEVVEELTENSSSFNNFEGAEVQVQVFAPSLDEAAGEPLTATVNDGVEFDNELPPTDLAGDEIFVLDVNLDIAGGDPGEGSISFEVDEDQAPGNFIAGDFNGYVFTDISDQLPDFENATLNESATSLGLEADDITFTENTIEVNVESLDYAPGLTALVDVEFADSATTNITASVTEEPVVGEPAVEVGMETIAENPQDDETNQTDSGTFTDDLIDLTAISAGESVLTGFNVTRNAGFNNTADFYEVDANGSVIDSASGTSIAIGEEGYAETAVANRVGLDLTGENGEFLEFSGELEGGSLYAPVLAVDSGFETLEDDNPNNDPTIYVAFPDANVDGFDHVRNSEPGVFEFEDLPGGGDRDFNDLVVEVSLESVDEPVVDEPVVDELQDLGDTTGGDEPVVDELQDLGDTTGGEPSDLGVQIVFEGSDIFSEPQTVNGGVSFQSAADFVLDTGSFPLTPGSTRQDTAGAEQFFDANPDRISGSGQENFVVDAFNPNNIALSNPDRVDSIAPIAGGSYIYEISDIGGTLPSIEGVSINPLSNLDVDSGDISFTENSISVDLTDVTGGTSETVILDIDFAGDGGIVSRDGSNDFALTPEQFVATFDGSSSI